MAIQPDKRPKQAQDESAGTNSTERYRYGAHTLTALAMITQPRGFTIQRDGSGAALGDVWFDHTQRWTTTRGKADHWDEGPLECLMWWLQSEREIPSSP